MSDHHVRWSSFQWWASLCWSYLLYDSCSTFRSQCSDAISAYARLVKFNPSILHMQNCLAPAICERRAYHTRSLWHPKFHLDFSKKIIWLKGGDISFSFKRTLPFKIFLWQEFYLVSPKNWFLVLEILSFYLDSNQNTSLLEKCLLTIPLKSPIAFGMIFSTFNKSLLPWPMCKSSSTNLSLPLDHDVPQLQQVEPPHIFIFHL